MPIYVYRCSCGQEREEQRKVDDRNIALPHCLKCGKTMTLAPALVAPQFPGADRWR